jgi:hypothetical protein
MPGGAAAPTRKPSPPTTSPVSVPPGYHYYEMHGIAYFLQLATGEKVNLGPVEPASSFVAPSGKKERMATVKMETGMATVKMESTTVVETTKRKVAGNDDVVDLSQNRPKKSRPVADEDVEVVQILDDDDDDDLLEEDLLPNTCDFTPAAKQKKDRSTSDESSDGGETVLGSQEQDLLLSSDS